MTRRPERAENLELMRRPDDLHLEHPVYGRRKRAKVLEQEGRLANRKRGVRRRRLMGIEAIHSRARTSAPGAGHRIAPCLLKGLEIKGPDEVWCADITCIPRRQGFMHLVVVLDWWSRGGLAWKISNTLESDFCVRPGNGRWRGDGGHRTSRTRTRDRSSPARPTLKQWNPRARR